MANTPTITSFAGNDVDLNLTIYQEDGITPYDLSTITALTYALALAPQGTPIVTKSLTGGITITNAAQGKFTVALASADTQGLGGAVGITYYHECTLVTSADAVITCYSGYITIYPTLIGT
jgi:hypothetical protein